jgi:hypothetical protein
MPLRTGLLREFSGGGAAGAALGSIINAAPPPILQRAVVIDVIVDPDLITDEYKQRIINTVTNPDLVHLMSVNTIIAKIVSNNEGNGAGSNTILFPFYSSNFMLPIAAGEMVYVIYEDPSGNGNGVGYWLSRVPGYGTIEDPNYTHNDRRFDPANNIGTYTTREEVERNRSTGPEDFPNGGNVIDSLTLPPDEENPTESTYTVIYNSAPSSVYVTPEPVPRWYKRPQELVIQGKNNSLIMLGEDRNGGLDGALSDNPIDITKTGGAPRQAGAIDIVAGRGRYLMPPGRNPKGGELEQNPPGTDSTAPLVIENTRGYLETDKNPFRNSRENIANPDEGNPSPMFDAARVYVVQQSKVDENYRLIPGTAGNGLIFPPECLPNEQPEPVAGVHGRSYVVNKADHVRIIARKELLSADQPKIAGTVFIVREGKQNTNAISSDPNALPTSPDGDLAYILLNKDGKAQIEANEIYLGRATALEQPYIRYTVYKATIEELQNQINALRDHIGTLEETLETAFKTAIAVPYSNIPSLYALGDNVLRTQVQFQQLDQSITTSDDVIKNIYNFNAKSTKIFGE